MFSKVGNVAFDLDIPKANDIQALSQGKDPKITDSIDFG